MGSEYQIYVKLCEGRPQTIFYLIRPYDKDKLSEEIYNFLKLKRTVGDEYPDRSLNHQRT